jgi:hypothetical protein
MKRFSILRAALCLLGLACASARGDTLTVNLTTGRLYDFGGVKLDTGSLVLLVGDTAQNGFNSFVAGSSLTFGSFLNSDDQILGLTTILPGGTGSAIGSFSEIPIADGEFSQLTAGDRLAVVWFSSVSGSDSSLLSGESYGLFSSSLPEVDGPDAWVIPSIGATIDIQFRTILGGGTHAENEAYANLTAIPEPSTYAAILGAGVLGFAIYRRKRR